MAVSIPRPRGQAGRTENGFHLQTEMGLIDNKPQYLAIRDNIRGYAKAHLEAGLPLTQQKDSQVWKVIQLVKHDHTFLARFENDWPVRCILSEYLGHSNGPKGSLKRKKALAKLAEARGETVTGQDSLAPAENSTEDTRISKKPKKTHKRPVHQAAPERYQTPKEVLRSKRVYKGKLRAVGIATESTSGRSVATEFGAGANVNMTPALDEPDDLAPSSYDIDMDNLIPSDDSDASQYLPLQDSDDSSFEENAGGDMPLNALTTKGKGKEKARPRGPTIRIPPAVASATPSPREPPVQLSPDVLRFLESHSADDEADGDSSVSILRQLQEQEADDIKYNDPDTMVCPEPGCEDVVPADPDPVLLEILDRRREVILKRVDGDLPVLNISLCKEIAYQVHLLPYAQAHGWPQHFSVFQLRQRVKMLKPVLDRVIKTPTRSFIWRLLHANGVEGVTDPASLHSKYTRSPADISLQDTFKMLRVGYYGETGEAIITSTLEVMYPSIDRNTIRPFDLTSFLHFILLPECALLLISKDCKFMKVVDAYKIMAASADYGYRRFAFDNDVVEEDGLSVAQVVIHENRLQVRKYQRSLESEIIDDQADPYPPTPPPVVVRPNAQSEREDVAANQSTGSPNSEAAPTLRGKRAIARNSAKEAAPHVHTLGEADFVKVYLIYMLA
ncbi:hypothetical protein C8Q77DRAFT_1076851 [Trametes polyzona]|nr:hypothetical protein C8Q77DRAFT_1076851 [Trametes polyzona]